MTEEELVTKITKEIYSRPDGLYTYINISGKWCQTIADFSSHLKRFSVVFKSKGNSVNK